MSKKKMRAVQVSKPKGPFELVEREIPEPGPGDVRIKVQACGICHSVPSGSHDRELKR
jgi:D-arabinose 1-dehydrogenase-like Zn-dependent alcohol dehydrogenase